MQVSFGKRLVFLLILSTAALSVSAQTNKTLSGSYQNQPLSTLIQFIEESTDYQFYYLPSWVDSVRITIEFERQPVAAILSKALSDSELHYYITGNRIILTQDIPVLPMDSGLFSGYTDSLNARLDHSFQRESANLNAGSSGPVNIKKEVGKKRLINPNGNAVISGYVKERKTGEPIIGAAVYIRGTSKAITTNTFGFYSLSLKPGTYTLAVQFTGMKEINQEVTVHSDGNLDIPMDEDMISLKEVMVEADRDANIANVQMGMNSIDMRSMKNVPKILGENDLLKVALTLPGVKTIGEGASGINVRGGNADQNLMMMNEATIYNTSHFLGFFSVFNADAIKSSELYKSGIPAQFGGRLSSIFDVQMKDGNQKKFSGQGGIGPVTSHLTLEIPIVKDKTSLMIGGRTTYSDWLLKQIPVDALKNSSASFYDFFGRITHNINDKNTLYLSAYYSKDKYKLSSDSLFSYHNALGSLQWRHVFNTNFHSLVSVTRSEYQYNIEYGGIPVNAFNLGFNIKESNFKWDLSYYLDKHKIDFGVQSKLYDLSPGSMRKESEESLVKEVEIQKEKGLENAFYVADNFDISPNLSLYFGLRYSLFAALGPRSIYTYSDGMPRTNASIYDTLIYDNNKVIKTYGGPEYRVSARYRLPGESSLKASYNRTRQYIHMLSNTVSVSPTNTWKLSDPGVKPQIADQVSLGFYKDLRNKTLEASVEVYYKWLQNIIDYKTGARLLLNENIEKDILQGQGKAYGVEFLLRKKTGKFNGWLSYTYSRTFIKLESEFPQESVNAGRYFPANYDKPHDLNLVSNYKITRRYSVSFNFAYSTGRPITYPVGLYNFGSGYRINYSDRNQYRIPDYIRLDLGFNIEGNHKIKKLAHSFWSFSIYNLLGRKNPYSVYFVAKEGDIKGYKLSIFGAPIPTITYNFKF